MSSERTWSAIGNLSLIGMLAALQGTLLVPLVAELPGIYGVSTVAGSWLLTITLLAGALATPVITRLADMFGKRRLVIITLSVMAAGSLLVAVSDNFGVALAGRAAQGFSSALIPVAMSIVKDIAPPERVGIGVALVSGTLGVGSAAGLPMAGLVYGALGWNAIFWITAGLAVLLILASSWLLPADRASRREPFDWVGAPLLMAGLTPLLLVITQGETFGWLSPETVLLAAGSAVAFGIWVPVQLRRRHPLVDLRLARTPTILLTNTAALVTALGMLANLLIASLQLSTPDVVDAGLGLPAHLVGLVMAAPAAIVVVMSPAVGIMIRRWGGRNILAAGALGMSLSYLARVLLDESVWQVAVGSVLVGVGTSLCFASMPIIIMSAVPSWQTAAANGVNSLCRMVGTSISTAGLAALTTATATVIDGVEYPTTTTVHSAFYICAAAAFVAMLLALFIPRGGRQAGGAQQVDGAAADGTRPTSRSPRFAIRSKPSRSFPLRRRRRRRADRVNGGGVQMGRPAGSLLAARLDRGTLVQPRRQGYAVEQLFDSSDQRSTPRWGWT